MDEVPGHFPSKGIGMPGMLERCNSPASQLIHDGVRSLKFWCEPNSVKRPTGFASTFTSTFTVWDGLQRGQTPSPALTTSTSVIRHVMPTSTDLVMEARAESSLQSMPEARDVAKGPYGHKVHWYVDPWNGENTCFMCWFTKKQNTDKFECQAGALADNTEKGPCGKLPEHDPVTIQIEKLDYLTETQTRTHRTSAPNESFHGRY
jgi:hypothetical protein